MKKFIQIICLVILLLGLMACGQQNSNLNGSHEKSTKTEEVKMKNQQDVRQVVWRQLSSQNKESIDGTWKDAKVSKIFLKESMSDLVPDKSYIGREVYIIDFPTKNISIPHNMLVYADIETFNSIGMGLVD